MYAKNVGIPSKDSCIRRQSLQGLSSNTLKLENLRVETFASAHGQNQLSRKLTFANERIKKFSQYKVLR